LTGIREYFGFKGCDPYHNTGVAKGDAITSKQGVAVAIRVGVGVDVGSAVSRIGVLVKAGGKVTVVFDNFVACMIG